MMKRLVAGGLAARKPMAANAAPVSPPADSGADPAPLAENNNHLSAPNNNEKMGNRMSISGLSAHKALDASQLMSMSNPTVGGERFFSHILIIYFIIK
jgi:hypothetical protein